MARAVEEALSDAEVIFVHDTPDHFPYATKTPAEIHTFIQPIFQGLLEQGCDAVVVACNTVSTTLIGRLRADFPALPLIAIEPMVKPAAAQTRSRVIAVCATPTTLASERYHELKQQCAQGIEVLEPDCADWSYLIEHNAMSDARIHQAIEPALQAGADVIVLGCTHYHWIETEVKQIAQGRAVVLQPEQAVVAQLRRVLSLSA